MRTASIGAGAAELETEGPCLGQEFFEQIGCRTEQAFKSAQRRAGVVDQFDRAVKWDFFDRPPQRPGDQGTESAGFFGVADGAQQPGPDRPRQLRVVDPVALFEAFAPLRRGQRPRQRLPRHPELAGGTVEGGDRELVGDFLQPFGIAPGTVLAGVLALLRRVGGATGGEVDADQGQGRDDRRPDQQPAPQLRVHRSTRRERPIGISASRPSRAASPKEGLKAWVAPRLSCSCSSSRSPSTAARSAGSLGSGSKAGPRVDTFPFSPSSRSSIFWARPILSSGLTLESRITAVPALIASSRCWAMSAVKIGVSASSPITTPAWRAEIVQPPWIACGARPPSAVSVRAESTSERPMPTKTCGGRVSATSACGSSASPPSPPETRIAAAGGRAPAP